MKDQLAHIAETWCAIGFVMVPVVLWVVVVLRTKKGT